MHELLPAELLLDDGTWPVTRCWLPLLALLSACACTADHVEPGPGWSPIQRVQEDSGTPRGTYRTVGTVTLTGSVCDFLEHSPAERRALGLHEGFHARREAELGLAQYLRDYGNSRSFRWAEESAGWRLQIEECLRSGVGVDAPGVARTLSTGYDGMIGFEPALAWVGGVIAGVKD